MPHNAEKVPSHKQVVARDAVTDIWLGWQEEAIRTILTTCNQPRDPGAWGSEGGFMDRA